MIGNSVSGDSLTSYYAFLPDGEAWSSDQPLETAAGDVVQRVRPLIVECLRCGNRDAALQLARDVIRKLTDELKPEWFSALEDDEVLVQALVVELDENPLVAKPDTTLSEEKGAAIWVRHRTWITSRAEAAALADDLSGGVRTDGVNLATALVFTPPDGRGGPWTRVWV